jgi:hypothetical protein
MCTYILAKTSHPTTAEAVFRIRIEKMRTRIQEKISMRIRIRIHAVTELWRAK